MVGIYKIVNSINDKVYIGQSNDIKRRWWEHKSQSIRDNGSGNYKTAIHSAIRKYGVEHFSVVILEICEEHQLDDRERWWIAHENSLSPNGYNLMDGGQQFREKSSKVVNHCIHCGKEIYKGSKLCKACAREDQKDKWFDLQKVLFEIFEANGIAPVAKKYGVSFNLIQKKLKKHHVPHKSKEVLAYYRALHNIPEPIVGVIKKKDCKVPIKRICGDIVQRFCSYADAERKLGIPEASIRRYVKIGTQSKTKWRWEKDFDGPIV